MLAFHFMWFDWHDMVTKVPVPSAFGITNAPPPNFCSILQNIRFGMFTLLPEYPLRYCWMTATVGGGARGGGENYGLIWEETVEKPRRGKSKTTAGIKTGGGGGEMETHPVQGGGRHPPLRGSERGPRPSEEYVRPGWRTSTPLRVRWPNNLLGLLLAGGVQFELQPQVGPLSLRGGGH